MPDDIDDVFARSSGKELGRGVCGHEGVEDGDGVFAFGAVEEGYGDQEAEWVVGEALLDEAEVRDVEGREGDAGDEAARGSFVWRDFGGSFTSFGGSGWEEIWRFRGRTLGFGWTFWRFC